MFQSNGVRLEEVAVCKKDAGGADRQRFSPLAEKNRRRLPPVKNDFTDARAVQSKLTLVFNPDGAAKKRTVGGLYPRNKRRRRMGHTRFDPRKLGKLVSRPGRRKGYLAPRLFYASFDRAPVDRDGGVGAGDRRERRKKERRANADR